MFPHRKFRGLAVAARDGLKDRPMLIDLALTSYGVPHEAAVNQYPKGVLADRYQGIDGVEQELVATMARQGLMEVEATRDELVGVTW